ncbi:hypothetical protein [Pseudanabaena sp. PCC 6802]|uniref:hypothetical protein n=1 Tax=Pseudanabaena sp. PCC 6802 TaxID=118173 RepID=UPI000347A4DA|nr:hypothetical protein [Pseudanabaena sp. PCC 6802]
MSSCSKPIVGALVGGFTLVLTTSINSIAIAETLPTLLRQAASSNSRESQAAIAALRQFKDEGVQAFWQTYQTQLPTDERLRKVLDQICQQKDCDMSRLYWYTDLEQAKAAAKTSNKPILSLRLLGYLDEDLSCANSRFFRTVLYPNAEISQYLRDRFILHWQSVRPVPKVTIDFGDGRKLQRTLTGNSIHYILDSEGRTVDALPGLYAPKAFYHNLAIAEQAALQSSKLAGNDRTQWLRSYHSDRLNVLQTNWRSDLVRLGIAYQPLLASSQVESNLTSTPDAEIAGRRAIAKSAPEIPLLRRTRSSSVLASNNDKLTDTQWQRMAALNAREVKLDDNSQALMRRKLSSQSSFPQVLANFERAIAQDTVRNEYLFHARLHQWLAEGTAENNLNALNERVYSELFLTPSSDRWLGLSARDVYTGIEAQ